MSKTIFLSTLFAFGVATGHAQEMTVTQGLSADQCVANQASMLRGSRATSNLSYRSADGPRQSWTVSAMDCFHMAFARCGSACAGTATAAAPLLDYYERAPAPTDVASADRQLSDLRALLDGITVSTTRQRVTVATAHEPPSGFSQCSMRVGFEPGVDAMRFATDRAYATAHPRGPQPGVSSPGDIQTAFENYVLSLGSAYNEILGCRALAHSTVRFARVRGTPRVPDAASVAVPEATRAVPPGSVRTTQ